MNNISPKVSIILPCFNGEKYLSHAIEAILNQTYRNLELIFVNDCSNDKSLDIAQNYANIDKRLKIINNMNNEKLPQSLNIGFKNADGEYLSWTSDDNFYHPTAIEEMVNFLKENKNIDLVCCDYKTVDENDGFLGNNKVQGTKSLIEKNSIGACFLYRKSISKKIGEYDKNKFLVEDYDYWLRLGLIGKIACLHKILYTYRFHKSSLTTKRLNEIIEKSELLKKEYRSKYLKKFPSLIIIKILRRLKKKFFRKKNKQKEYEKKMFSVERFNKSLDWIKKYTIENKGIAVESNQPHTIYPEVTGYFIPTLLNWGERERAKNFADYLLTIQNEDGSWNEPSGKISYTFDTGQILKGLWEFIDEDEKYKKAFFKGCDWILSQQRDDGSLSTPNYSSWGLSFDNKVPEAIHIYCLEPLKKAANKFGIEKYKICVEKALKFYISQKDLTNFDTLSHFHAYIIEGLIDIGEIECAQKAMDKIAQIQKKNGAVSAYLNVDFVCSTGLFQYAICWFKLGDIERGNRAFAYALSLQNSSGGFFGSYGKNANYFEKSEISWAIKYFLDALYYSQKCSYDGIFNIFPKSVDVSDGRFETLDKLVFQNDFKKVLDLGCGKGRFSRELIKKYPNIEFYGVDISKNILDFIPEKLIAKQGSILNIPFCNENFDFVFCIESLEHAINIDGAMKEVSRVLKKNGHCLIIDKDVKALGKLELAPWEQWFDKDELKSIMQKNGFDVKIIENIAYGADNKCDGLFAGWVGKKEDKLL